MSDISDILAEAANPDHIRITVARILLRQDLLVRHDELEAELEAAVKGDARENRVPTAPAISQRIVDLEAEIEAAKREFKFKSIGHRAWADLMAEHPPTKEQVQAAKKIDSRYTLDHDPVTFPPVAISKSCFDPVMTVDDVHVLETLVNDTQWNELLVCCVKANTAVETPKSAAASAILRLNGQYATTPALAESLGQSSSAA